MHGDDFAAVRSPARGDFRNYSLPLSVSDRPASCLLGDHKSSCMPETLTCALLLPASWCPLTGQLSNRAHGGKPGWSGGSTVTDMMWLVAAARQSGEKSLPAARQFGKKIHKFIIFSSF
jgi:hypothetical protein